MKVSDQIQSVYKKFPNQIELTISIGEGEKGVDFSTTLKNLNQ